MVGGGRRVLLSWHLCVLVLVMVAMVVRWQVVRRTGVGPIARRGLSHRSHQTRVVQRGRVQVGLMAVHVCVAVQWGVFPGNWLINAYIGLAVCL